MDKNQIREVIARRVALELKDNDVVNLGIGIPTWVPNYLKPEVHVVLQSENGMIGMGKTPAAGEEDPHFANAGGAPVLPGLGAACFDSATSFAIIRGGHVDVSVLGALQVDMIVTEMCVIEVTDNGLLVTEIHPEFTAEDVQAATEATLRFSENLKLMRDL